MCGHRCRAIVVKLVVHTLETYVPCLPTHVDPVRRRECVRQRGGAGSMWQTELPGSQKGVRTPFSDEQKGPSVCMVDFYFTEHDGSLLEIRHQTAVNTSTIVCVHLCLCVCLWTRSEVLLQTKNGDYGAGGGCAHCTPGSGSGRSVRCAPPIDGRDGGCHMQSLNICNEGAWGGTWGVMGGSCHGKATPGKGLSM